MTGDRREHLLQSPRFPGVRGSVADVVAARSGGAMSGDVAAVAAAIVAARVGGRFWGGQASGRRRLIVGMPAPTANLDDTAVVASRQTARRFGRSLNERGALVVDNDVDPWSLIDAAEEVEGDPHNAIVLLALMAGRRVTEGGVTVAPERATALLAGALFDGRRYRDPTRNKPADVMEAIAVLADWRRLIDSNRGVSVAAGVAWWKRREVERLLWDGTPRRLPSLSAKAALRSATPRVVAAWPSRVPSDFGERAQAADAELRWVEDGFLRSVGLGSNMVPPLSLTVDRRRPYFDAAGPSDLEVVLLTHPFPAAMLERAAALRRRIVAGRIGKYRAGGTAAAAPADADPRPTALVIGQVEDDLSVQRGGAGVTGNLDLLRRVRAEEPDSRIVYRPHPDVEAGQRRGAIPDADVLRHADAIDRDGLLDDLIAAAARVHVLTSLAGFEALMRGRPVVVHGWPFYAGWGLTVDRAPRIARRARRLTLDALVAGTLIAYPRYLHPRQGLPCSPEAFVEGLELAVHQVSWLVRLRSVQGRVRRALGSRHL